MDTDPSSARLLEVARAVARYSEAEGWKGWNKHDGLNSPIMAALLGWGRWPRMVAIQGVMRFPINLRPWLLTPKVYNPKGLALFAQALLDLHRTTAEPEYLRSATALLDLLLELRSPDLAGRSPWSGACWGYHYPWQDPGFYAPTNMPNAVVTTFVCEAMLDGWRTCSDPRYLDAAASASGFFLNDLIRLKDTDAELCLGYMPVPMTMRVMDVSVLIGAVLAQLAAVRPDPQLSSIAERLVRYVVNRQTDYAAWYYTDPPGDSHIRHDNYHTGFILDALDRYGAAANDRQWQRVHDRGLEFYAARLFNEDGAPRWMSDTDYPHDIHGAAQGILTFARCDRQLARRIAGWALRHMYDPSGRFYYQRSARFTKRFTLLRWCNAWMLRGLAALLRAESAAL